MTTDSPTATSVARALLSMPRVAVRILLFPVLLAFATLLLQLWLTSQAYRTNSVSPDAALRSLSTHDSTASSMARRLAYGSATLREPIKRCIWEFKNGVEFPPGKDCLVSPHDIAIIGEQVAEKRLPPFLEKIIEQVSGSVERVHLCRQECAASAGSIVALTPATTTVTINGFTNFLLLNEALRPQNTSERVSVLLPGEKYLNLRGVTAPVHLSGLDAEIAKLLGLVMLVVACVWLSLRAYRKVLDYFSASGSLLPLAAAVSPAVLYRALWIIAAARVGLFLIVALPFIMMQFFSGQLGDQMHQQVGNISHSLLWIIALTASLALTTVCASVADLNRRGPYGFIWRYLPVALVIVGFIGWVFTLVDGSEGVIGMRNIVTALPLIGLTPVLAASIINPPEILLVIHGILATLAFVIIARYNVRWFAHHIEEV